MDPGNASAYHFLGILANQADKPEIPVSMIEQAVSELGIVGHFICPPRFQGPAPYHHISIFPIRCIMVAVPVFNVLENRLDHKIRIRESKK